MFEYVSQKESLPLRKACEEILIGVQREVSDYFTFQFYLIGSGEKRLVTKNDGGTFDLDYNLVLMRDKKGLLDNPKKIKDIFLCAFNKVAPYLGFSFAENSTSVITSKCRLGNVHFSFDCAIMYENNDGSYYKIVFDKPDRYIWNEVKNTKDFDAKFHYLRSNNFFPRIKELYLKKKNSNRSGKSSFSLLSETVNEIIQRYVRW